MDIPKNVYKIFGYSYGSFKDKQSGRDVEFKNVCLGKPIVFPDQSNAVYEGFNAEKRKCSNLSMLQDLHVGDWVMAFFDDVNRDKDPKKQPNVAYMVKLTSSQIDEYGLHDIDPYYT